MQPKSVGGFTLQPPTKSWFVLEEFANRVTPDTTELAAIAAWEILQGFYSLLPQLDSEVESKEFNLWTGINNSQQLSNEAYNF
jgi:hypothetical protein